MQIISQFKGIEIFFEFLLKSSFILAITLFFSFLFRKKSASFRHFLLSISLMVLLVLPFLIAFAPGWQSGMIPSLWGSPLENLSVRDFEIDKKSFNSGEPGSISPGISPSAENDKSSPFLLFLQELYPNFLVTLWGCGLIFLLSKLALGLYGTSRITSQGVSINGYPWKQLFLLFLKKTPLKRKIRLLKNKNVIVPMTWGVRKPVIIMPGQSATWPVEQCSTVLFHELYHVKRGDFLVRLLSRVTCSLYWFNPLCWIVFRQLKKEQEKACDEMVLKAGIKPSTYASCLLRIRKCIDKEKGRYVPVTVIGMAGQSEFKERLTVILKNQSNPKEEKMKTRITLLILGIFAAVLIGTAKPAKASLLSSYEEAAVSQTAAAEQKAVSTDEEKEKKKEKKSDKADKAKEKKAKDEKEKKQFVWVGAAEDEAGKKDKKCEKKIDIFISEDEDDQKNEKKEKPRKILLLPHDSGIKTIKVEGDYLVIYEKDKPVKKIKLKSKDGKNLTLSLKGDKIIAFIGEKGKDVHIVGEDDIKKIGKNIQVVTDKDGKKVIRVGKAEGIELVIVNKDKKGKDKDIYIKKAGKDKDVHIVMEKGKLAKIGEKGVWIIKEGEGKAGKKVFTIKKGSDEELKKNLENLKKGLKSIDKEFKAKSPDQEKALKDMEEAVKKMEQELQKKEDKHKKVEVILEDPERKAVKIDEADRKHVTLKRIKEGDFFLSTKDTEFSMEFTASETISKQQEEQINKAVARLKKKLPESFKVKSKISHTAQEITISSGEGEPGKVSDRTVNKEIKKFEEELEKILPGAKGKKSITKKIWVKKKEEKKK